LVRRLGLPIRLPQALTRAGGPWEDRPLEGARVLVSAAARGSEPALHFAIARALFAAGAVAEVARSELGAYAELAGSCGGSVAHVEATAIQAGGAVRALLFDATQIETVAALRQLYDFFHPTLPRLENSGRVVLLARASAASQSAEVAAVRGALEGFVRSLAKEVGRRGATALLLVVESGAEARVAPVLRFLLSARSVFVSGQTISLTSAVACDPEPPLVRALASKVALVTGAARGIGAACAELLAAQGAHVVCLDRPQDEALVHDVARRASGSVLLADLGDHGVPELIRRHLSAEHGGVDVLVHNAGITRDKTLARMAPELWDQALDVNLAAVLRIDDALDRGLLRDGARLVYVSSVSGIAGGAGQTNYSASKAGLLTYARRRARELAPRGITCNAVAPGFIETRLTKAMPAMLREVARRMSALGQGGLPEDVANVITFLASPGAAAITGASLRVCGGALLEA
jgi:3-oxoacyl-[acyl-carrier protein] reductase